MIALLLAASGAAGAEKTAPVPEAHASSGDLSTVTLLDVLRLPGAILDVVQPGAEDGLVFLFLVVKRPGAEGKPTVRELRDFEVDDESYRARTAAKLGAAIEPVSFVEDVNDFLERVSPEDEPAPRVPDGEAYVVVATIGGAKLPDEARCALEVELGWGGRTEALSFSFAVPPLPDLEALEIPAVPRGRDADERGPSLWL